MANIVFKKGKLSDLQLRQARNEIEEGALYFTEDEGGLYLGVKQDEQTTTSLKRMQGSILCFNTYDELTSSLESLTSSSDVLYYVVKDNAIYKYDEQNEKLIYVTTSNTVLNNLTDRVQQAETAIETIISVNTQQGIILSAQNEQLKTAKGNIDYILAELVTINQNISKNLPDQFNSSIDSLETKIQAEEARAKDAEKALDEKISDSTDEIKENIDKIKEDIDDIIKSNIDDITQDITNIEQDIVSHNTAIEEVKQRCTNLEKTSSDHEYRIKTLEDDQEAQDDRMSDIEDNVLFNYEEIIALQGSHQELSNIVDQTKTQASANAKDIADHAIELDNLSKAQATKVNIDGTSEMTGALQMNNHPITGVIIRDTPQSDDAANIGYVDQKTGVISGAITQVDTKLTNMFKFENSEVQLQQPLNINGKSLTGITTDDQDGTSAASVSYVNQMFATNDAMKFIGVLDEPATWYTSNMTNDWSDIIVDGETPKPQLPDSAYVGDTYKVGALGNYTYKKGKKEEEEEEDNKIYAIAAKVGDLIINASEKDGPVTEWVHVSSGYEDSYLQKIFLGDNNTTIYLNDGIYDNELHNYHTGALKFIGETNSNLNFVLSKNPTNSVVHDGSVITVTGTMTWGSF